MGKYNMGKRLNETVKWLYGKATSALIVQSTVGKKIHTSVGVYQGCLLSPTLFNIFLECLVTDALGDYSNIICIGG